MSENEFKLNHNQFLTVVAALIYSAQPEQYTLKEAYDEAESLYIHAQEDNPGPKYIDEIHIEAKDFHSNYRNRLVDKNKNGRYLIYTHYDKFTCSDYMDFKDGFLVGPKELIRDLDNGKLSHLLKGK